MRQMENEESWRRELKNTLIKNVNTWICLFSQHEV